MSDLIDTHQKQDTGYHATQRTTTPPKTTPNPYPGVPTIHHEPRQGSHTQSPSKPRKPQHAPDGQAKEEKHRHTKATQGTEPNTPHLGGHTFAPPPDMSRLHTFTHQGSPTRLRPTRNNPPQPQIPQRGRQARRSEDRRPMPWRITTSNHPDQQASDPTRHQPQKNHPHRDHTSTRGQRTGETHSKQQDTQTPKAAHQHETTQPPHLTTRTQHDKATTPTNLEAPNTPNQQAGYRQPRHHKRPPPARHTQPASRHSSQSKSKGDDK